MSLLEDIFLQDEADEAQELERVIEGDDFDRPRSRSESPEGDDENTNREDEAEEDKRRVDPSSTKAKRVVKNPRFILNPARLTGPRGIQVIPDHFKDFKFKGKGHEKEDLDMVLKRLEHWAYRLYPKFQFEDCLKKIETLGKKRPVMVHLQKIRTDQFISDDTVVQKDSSDEETAPPQEEDEFDKLLQQQIDLARATPAPGSVKKVVDTPRFDRSPITMPKATSSPSISDEQKERMLRNRKLAEERRLARLKQNNSGSNESQSNSNITGNTEISEEPEITVRKHNKSNVIDSSDEECDVTSVNQAVTVDIHTNNTVTNNENVSKDNGTDNDIEMAENVIEIVSKDIEINNVTDNDHQKTDSVNDDVEFIKENTNLDDKCDHSVEKVFQEDASKEITYDKDSVDDAIEIIEENIIPDVINDHTNIEKVVQEDISNKEITDNTNLKNNENTVPSSVPNEKSENEIQSNLTLQVEDTTIEKDIEENLIAAKENIPKDKEINKDIIINEENDNKQTNKNVEDDIPEELMDVDFSEEF